MESLSCEVRKLEEKVEILQKQVDSKERKRIVTDEQLKIMFWYISEILYCCVTPQKVRENNLEYDFDIRELFSDLSNIEGSLKGNNIRNDSYYRKSYDIMKKCYDEHHEE